LKAPHSKEARARSYNVCDYPARIKRYEFNCADDYPAARSGVVGTKTPLRRVKPRLRPTRVAPSPDKGDESKGVESCDVLGKAEQVNNQDAHALCDWCGAWVPGPFVDDFSNCDACRNLVHHSEAV